MEFDKTQGCPNPWNNANIVSKIFFCWLTPLFFKGSSGNLKLSDVYKCPDVETSEKVTEVLQKQWEKELKKQKSGKKPSLARAAVRAYGLFYCLNALIAVIEECFIPVLQPVLLGYLIQHFTRLKVLSALELNGTAAGICLLSAVFVVTHHTYFFAAERVGMKLRIACCSLVYKKALRLSQSALGKTTVGQMVNLLSNDVNRFDQSVMFLPYLIAGPIQAVTVICILWMHIGYASLAGVSVLMLYIPFQGMMGNLFSKLRMKTAVLTDERIRLMNEIIAGMRVIKMYGWELPFAKLVDLSRKREMGTIRQASFLRGVNLGMLFISSKVILLVAFAVFLLGVQGDLTPEKVFVSMALFDSLRRSMTLFFPFAIAQGAESLISLKRIQRFLLLEEQSDSSHLDVSNLRPKLYRCGIWMNEVQASWNKDGETTLRNVSLSVKPGELLAIVGPVGCGKTSVLMSILGELPITSGEVKVRGRVAYASQEPWVLAGSVRENVLFGSEFDEAKYKKVLSVCALDKDIEQLPYGDQTAVGERGVSLSGGQKARVNLARAMYFDADIFLLDDPLSAVDTSVAKHLFEECINGYLKDKVRILATHQIQFLKEASQILVLQDGGCLGLGTYDQLSESGVDLGSLVEDIEQERHRTTSTASTTSIIEEVTEVSMPITMYESNLSVNSSGDGDYEEKIVMNDTSEKPPKPSEEEKSSGSVGLEMYKEYIRSGAGPFLQLMILILYIGTQILSNGSDFWLTAWTNLEQRKYNIKHCWGGANKTFLNETGFYEDPSSVFNRDLFRQTVANVADSCFVVTRNYTEDMHDADEQVNMKFRLSVYTGLVLMLFVLSLLRTTAFYELSVRASISLHNKMFRSVLRSPVAFFDSNPVGRVLNRFSKDIGVIDESLTLAAIDTVTIFCNLIGIVCVVAIVQPYLLIPTVIASAIFVYLRQFYLPTSRDVKRYEGITRSPVFSHLSTSLYGLTTIRAFKVQRPFEVIFDRHQDRHTATWFTFISVTRWFGVLLDWLCVFYLTAVIIAMVILSEDPSDASRAGLAIASALQLNGSFQFGVRQSTEVENQMTSVERVIEYSNLKSEADLNSEEDKKPPKDWPSKGCIVYKNVSLRYVPNEPPVLKNISFEVYPEEKVGIVGRTGAGKSSMIATLFRMTEPEGEVKIDGVCIKEIGLHELRKKISIIPQDPVLFTGPVRRNLDPFGEHSDDELWLALDEAYLKESIKEMPGGLDTVVSEGGSNFSVGQRQLICLARAILRRSRILVLDEATANVDPNTDSFIQKTIRDRFARCTVLTIAHRLHTIMDSDRVLVLDAGEVKEFDEPYKLLLDSKSLLSLMVRMTGPGMAKHLREVACMTYLKNAANKDEESAGTGVVLMNDSNFIPRRVNAVGPNILQGIVNEAFEYSETTRL